MRRGTCRRIFRQNLLGCPCVVEKDPFADLVERGAHPRSEQFGQLSKATYRLERVVTGWTTVVKRTAGDEVD